jgi:hypothetical protein
VSRTAIERVAEPCRLPSDVQFSVRGTGSIPAEVTGDSLAEPSQNANLLRGRELRVVKTSGDLCPSRCGGS